MPEDKKEKKKKKKEKKKEKKDPFKGGKKSLEKILELLELKAKPVKVVGKKRREMPEEIGWWERYKRRKMYYLVGIGVGIESACKNIDKYKSGLILVVKSKEFRKLLDKYKDKLKLRYKTAMGGRVTKLDVEDKETLEKICELYRKYKRGELK